MSFAVYEPTTLTEALSLLAREGDAGAALAGGTDLLLRMRRRVRRYRAVINIKFIPGLAERRWDDDAGLTFGALTTFRQLETDPQVAGRYPALVEASRVVAGVQLRNLATIGGNLGNASPSADSVPPLVALGALVEIASAAGSRGVPVEASLIGPGRTILGPGEVFATIRIPPPLPRSGNAFERLGPRSAMDIGVVSAAAAVAFDSSGHCNDCRIALGAVSPAPLRAHAAETILRGERLTPALLNRAGELASEAAQPISDVRGTAEYRRAMVAVLVRRVVGRAASRALAGGA